MSDEATVETAYRAFFDARRGQPSTDEEFRAVRSEVEVKWVRAAIAAYESARGDVKPSPEKALEVVRAIEWACTEGRRYGGLDEDAAVADVLALWPGRSEREVASDALTDALHPEFGSEWREPDGEIWKALQSAKEAAWDEGESVGEAWVSWTEMDGNPKTEPSRDNPYRAKGADE